MKIYGPYTRKDGRQHILLKHDDGRKQTKSYPRYLLELHLGRELTEEETVDHIDGDFTNNQIQNLQILSRTENVKKYFEDSGIRRKIVEFICPTCGKTVEKYENYVKHNRKLGKTGPYCSRQCAGRATYINPWRNT